MKLLLNYNHWQNNIWLTLKQIFCIGIDEQGGMMLFCKQGKWCYSGNKIKFRNRPRFKFVKNSYTFAKFNIELVAL